MILINENLKRVKSLFSLYVFIFECRPGIMMPVLPVTLLGNLKNTKPLSIRMNILETWPQLLIASVIFSLILLFNWMGYRYKQRLVKKDATMRDEGLSPLESSLLGLLALLMAFSFGMAANKFDARRQLVIEEAENIEAAITLTDLFPDSVRIPLRQDLADYVQSRIDYYEAGIDDRKVKTSLQLSKEKSLNIWQRVTDLSQNIASFTRTQQMIQALIRMRESVRMRESSRIYTVPPVILWVLLVLTVTSGFLVGYGQKGKHRNLIMVFCFAFMTTVTLYLIFELDRPRQGLITVNAAEQNIVELRDLLQTGK